LERRYENGRNGRKLKGYRKDIYKMDTRSGGEETRIHGKEEKRDKMRTKMGRKAIAYEEKLERGGGTLWARRCWEEVKKRGGRRKSILEEQRKSFYEERVVSVEWVRGYRGEGEK